MDFFYSNIKKIFESFFIIRIDFIRTALFECLSRQEFKAGFWHNYLITYQTFCFYSCTVFLLYIFITLLINPFPKKIRIFATIVGSKRTLILRYTRGCLFCPYYTVLPRTAQPFGNFIFRKMFIRQHFIPKLLKSNELFGNKPN